MVDVGPDDTSRAGYPGWASFMTTTTSATDEKTLIAARLDELLETYDPATTIVSGTSGERSSTSVWPGCHSHRVTADWE